MPAVSGLGTTFNLPNYTGEVLEITRSDTPFLSAVGGLNGQGEVVTARQFEGQTQDLGDPSQPAILEGADAPTMSERSRGTWNNVTQIFQYAFGVSYTRLAAVQQLAGLAIGTQNPVTDEISYQTDIQLKSAARDINYTFVNGAYALPADNATARKTRGLLAAISTNALDNLGTGISAVMEADDEVITAAAHGLENGQQVNISAITGGTGLTAGNYWVINKTTNTFQVSATEGGAAVAITADASAMTVKLFTPLTAVRVLDLVQTVWDSHGIDGAAEPTLLCNARLKRALTKLFITDKNYQEVSRNVAGVSLTTIQTDFGTLNILVDRVMPVNTLAFAHLGLCKPAYLLIPERGFLFVEPLAKVGAQDKYQLYGEVGLWHGPEVAHAKITNVGFVSGA